MTGETAKARKCVECGKPQDPLFKPFCSKRCADLDLHRWLNGRYAIAGEDAEDRASSDQGASDRD
jgi:uncharacterized protein